MSELEEIRVFVQLVESQSATKAAERMDVAVSAISRRMKDLETRLGVQLVRRTTRRMNLTDSGTLYYRYCRQILDDIDEARQAVTSTKKELSGSLKIATPLTFGASHMAPAIAAFVHSHPEIMIDVDMSDRRVDLIEEGFDLAIRVGELEDSTLIAKRLAPVNHVVCASPDYLNTHGIPTTPDELKDLPALCYSHLKNPDSWQYTTPSGDKGTVKVGVRMQSNNGDALREAAVAGLGLLCEPTFIVHSAVEKGLLKPVLTDYKWYGMNVYAIYPQTRHLSSKVRAFIDFLRHRFGDKPYWEQFLLNI